MIPFKPRASGALDRRRLCDTAKEEGLQRPPRARGAGRRHLHVRAKDCLEVDRAELLMTGAGEDLSESLDDGLTSALQNMPCAIQI